MRITKAINDARSQENYIISTLVTRLLSEMTDTNTRIMVDSDQH